MIDNAKDIFTHINMYSVSLIAIVCILFLTSISRKFNQGVRIPLQLCIIISVIFFGYKVYTGNNLYSVMTTPSQSEIEAAKYEKVVIDGREVFYNKNTGEVVKKIK